MSSRTGGRRAPRTVHTREYSGIVVYSNEVPAMMGGMFLCGVNGIYTGRVQRMRWAFSSFGVVACIGFDTG